MYFVLYCIVFIHFYSASLSMSHSEALPTTALILCQSLHAETLRSTARLLRGGLIEIRTCDIPDGRHRTPPLSHHAPHEWKIRIIFALRPNDAGIFSFEATLCALPDTLRAERAGDLPTLLFAVLVWRFCKCGNFSPAFPDWVKKLFGCLSLVPPTSTSTSAVVRNPVAGSTRVRGPASGNFKSWELTENIRS